MGIQCTPKKDHALATANSIDSIINLEFETSPKFPASFKAIHKLPHDSLKPKYLNRIANLSRVANNNHSFYKASKQSLKIAESLQDSLLMGEVHWEYGMYYRDKNTNDSSYYHYSKAYRFYEKSNPYYAGKMLYNMAFVNSRIKDYTGSEILIFEALKVFKPLRKNKQLVLCHNFLGTIYHNLKEYDEALYHYETALNYLVDLDKKALFFEDIQNNIGLLYQHLGDQNLALEYFDKALKYPELIKKDAALYARIIDNKGFSKFLMNDMETVPWELEAGLKIRDSIKNEAGSIISHLHLASFYLKKKDSLEAQKNAWTAYKLGKKLDLHRDVLSALLLLAEIEPKRKEDYLKEFIKVNKALEEKERKVRNKFTRIQFETEGYMERNAKLVQEQLYIISSSIALTLILILTGVTLKQRAKNRLLQMQAAERKAKEEILELRVKKQENLEQGRRLERTRIAEELHDTILANLFGIRLSWEQIPISGTPEALNNHRGYIMELQNLERRIRDLSHELTDYFFLTDKNFEFDVENLFKKWSEIGKFRYKIRMDIAIRQMDVDVYFSGIILRIFEEALQNTTRHGYARNVYLEIKQDSVAFYFVLQDDGLGFNIGNKPTGIGIKNMYSRVSKLKGTINIVSSEGNGTKIEIQIPKDKNDEA